MLLEALLPLVAVSVVTVMFLLGWLLVLVIDEKRADKVAREEIEAKEDIESMPDMFRRD